MPRRRLDRRRISVALARAATCLSLWCVLLPAGPALSGGDEQDQQEDRAAPPPPAAGGGAPADSGSVTVVDRLGIHPQYTTSVDVNKTSVQWSQNLKMNRDLGPLQMANDWAVIRNRNSAQNNYHLNDAKTAAKLEYHLPGSLGFSTGADFDLKKTLSASDVGRTVRNADHFDGFFTAGLPGRMVSRLFGLEEGVVSWDVTTSAGLTQGTDVRQSSVKDVATGEYELSRSDSTRAEGDSRAADSRLSVTIGKTWTLDLSGSTSVERQDSRTRQLQRDTRNDRVTIDTLLSAPTSNRAKRLAWSAAWTPSTSARFAVTGQAVRTYDRSYSPTVKDEDTTEGKDQKLGFETKWTPFWGIAIDNKFEASRTDLVYARNLAGGRGREGKRLDGRATFTLGKRFGPLERLESTTEWRWENSDNTFQAARSYRSRSLVLGQQFRRPIAGRFVVVAKGEGNLLQSFYRDHSQDRDDLRMVGDLTLGYRPSTRWDTRISGQLLKKQALSIPAQSSASSYTTNSYQIGAEMSCQASPALKVAQKCTFSADYSFYDFDENRNFLTRLTEVRTTLTGHVGARADLALVHLWQFRDSGRFGRAAPGAARSYTRQTKDTYQVLEATTAYAFSDELRLSARQRIEVRDRTRLDTRVTTHTREGLEFAGGMEMNHSFSQDFQVRAKVERTQSTRERNFWRVNASASRNF